MAKKLTLLLGGARSGKSSYAEQWAQQHGGQVLFVATAQAFDEEMQQRIETTAPAASSHWTTLESPLNTGEKSRNYGRRRHLTP